jgi:glutathione S-transferase
LTGTAFSIADLNVASAMVRALAFDLAKWPKVHHWLHSCWDRPAAKRALAMRA